MTVTFHGFNTHPGYAKERMVNAIKLAAEFITRLPRGRPVAGDDRRVRGIRPSYVVDASVERTSVKVLIRDFCLVRPAAEGSARRTARA